MTDRHLGSRVPLCGPTVALWRIGPFWRRRYEVRCEVCGPMSRAPVRGIGWIRVDGHLLGHKLGLYPKQRQDRQRADGPHA